MERRRVLLLPGSANPQSSEKYRLVYGIIKRRAVKLECEFDQIDYPGWKDRSERLNFNTAFQAGIRRCREFRPEWIIGRSLGCDIAVAVLSSGESWVTGCKGAVLWGPSVSTDNHRLWPTSKEKKKEIAGYAKHGTFLSEDFFDSTPPLEKKIASAACNLRIARGKLDPYNTPRTISILQEVHAKAQASFQVETMHIPGLAHSVIGSEGRLAVEQYFKCLFRPVYDASGASAETLNK